MSDEFDYEADDAAALEEWRQAQAQRRIDQLHARRPRAFARPGTLNPAVRAWCDAYAAGEPGSLVLVGPVGVGKTWTIWAAVEYLIRHHHWAGRFEMATAYALQRAAAPPVNEPQLAHWINADLLALDDLGAQRLSTWDAGHLDGIINARWEEQTPQIITSNDANLKALLGERSASRVRDNTVIVTLTGNDRRELRP